MTDDFISTLYRKPCPSCARQYARDSRACPFCGYMEGMDGEAEEDQERLYGEYLVARCKQSRDETEHLRREVQRHPGDRNRERLWALAQAEDQALDRELKAYQEGRHRPDDELQPPAIKEDDGSSIAAAAKQPDDEHSLHAAKEGDNSIAQPIQRTDHKPSPHVAKESHGGSVAKAAKRPDRKPSLPAMTEGNSGGVAKAAQRLHQEPPSRAAGDKECPVCTATVPHDVGRCACGYVFGGTVTQLLVCPHCTASVEAGSERCGCGYPIAVGPAAPGIPGLSKR
ncbi:MAG: zinc ribbon domain-containing protein [Acidiferrobacter sp.]